MATICLNMIVKNEAANIERCLRSVADYISCWVIGDTGSTDGTPEMIEEFFASRGIPGELHKFPFENFEQARNESLDRARAAPLQFDYLLLTDADMELTVQKLDFAERLTAAAYQVLQHSGVTYWNNRLLRRDAPARYRGVTHEYLDVLAGDTERLTGLSFIDHASGGSRADKYERDARLLRAAIAEESDPGLMARYMFYLANTLRDGGERDAALTAYLERSRLGHWQQEVFVSLLNAARLKEQLGFAPADVIRAYEEATASCPTRAEALHGAARFCRNKGIHERGYDFAARGSTIAYPTDALFVEDWIYEYGLLDELSINAYWAGRYAECVASCDRLLSEGKIPTDQRDRVETNKRFATDRLPVASALREEMATYLTISGSQPEFGSHPWNETAAMETRTRPIPKVFHFITGLEKDFGGKPFSFVHYMAIRSALSLNRSFKAKVYCCYEPSGPYWDMIKADVELVHVEPPSQVFGRPVEHFAHKADVLRLQILLEHGGVYLDMDTICQQPFEPLLQHGRVVMGREEKSPDGVGRQIVGLCNAVIMAPPDAEFLRKWYDSYGEFVGGTSGDGWNKFSVQIPLALAHDNPDLIHIEPASSFFWPSWDDAGLAALFSNDMAFPDAFSFHLWESRSWHFLEKLDAETVESMDTTYNRIARRFTPARPVAGDPEDARSALERLYAGGAWGSEKSFGALPENNIRYSAFLQEFMRDNAIGSVVEFGCGDWLSERYVRWDDVDFVGIDFSSIVVERNQRRYGRPSLKFEKLRSLDQIPSADLLVCKDVLQHVPNRIVKECLEAFKSRYKYMLITNDDYPTEIQNVDIAPGGWRTLRLDRAPFSERAAIVFSSIVLAGPSTVRKATYLICGNPC